MRERSLAILTQDAFISIVVSQMFLYHERKHRSVTTEMKVKTSEMLYVTAFCNIDGIWEQSKRITVK